MIKRLIAAFLALSVLCLPLEARRRWIPKVVSGGTPTGNAFTFVDKSSIAADGITISAGNIGDLIVVIHRWEGSVSQTSCNTDATGSPTITQGTQFNNGGSNGEPHIRFAWFRNTTISAQNITFTMSGGTSSPSTWFYRFTVSGTVSTDTEASGQGSSGVMASGTFTTGTVNGLTLVSGCGYTGGITYTNNLVGGNTGAGADLNDSCNAFYYLNTAQLSGATANTTPSNTTLRWTLGTISLKSL